MLVVVISLALIGTVNSVFLGLVTVAFRLQTGHIFLAHPEQTRTKLQ